MIHPWNRTLFQHLGGDRARLPHALLLHGRVGVGKRDLALGLAAWLLCETPTEAGACGQCDACNWFAQGNHPDFRLLEPREEEADEAGRVLKKAGRQIQIEAVRAVIEFIGLSAHRGGWRCALIHPAEYMNAAAANALLKTLEEPPPRVLILLVAHQPGRLPATVRSRCRQVVVPPPPTAQALVWLRETGVEAAEIALAEAGGAPLRALDFAEPQRRSRMQGFLDALARPEALQVSVLAAANKDALADCWGWLARWLHDLLALRLAGSARYFAGRAEAQRRLATAAELSGLLTFQRELSEAARWLQHPLNAQLLLESWLVRYIQVTRGKP